MKIAEFNKLFEKIRLLIYGSDHDEAIIQLNIMGEELIKAETSMDKFRDRVRNKRAELKEVLAQTGSRSGDEMTGALEKTLHVYDKKWKELQREFKQLRNEYEVIDSQISYLKDGTFPDSMRPNLESMTSEPKPRQVKGPINLAFYNL